MFLLHVNEKSSPLPISVSFNLSNGEIVGVDIIGFW